MTAGMWVTVVPSKGGIKWLNIKQETTFMTAGMWVTSQQGRASTLTEKSSICNILLFQVYCYQ